MGASCSSGNSTGATQTGNLGTWYDILHTVADMELWKGQPRAERDTWRAYLQQAEDLARTQKRRLPEDLVAKVLHGDLSDETTSQVPKSSGKVVIFVSSTFTDTKAERNILMRDVYPYLRRLCRTLGLNFGTVDMRWGVKEETAMQHDTVNVCLGEISRCKYESVGPAFMAILGHKYGYRPPPAEIVKEEFEEILNILKEDGQDISLLTEYYLLDENALNPEYALKSRTADMKDWWDTEKAISEVLRTAAAKLDPEKAEKYFISITEREIKEGIIDNQYRGKQVLILQRGLMNIKLDKHRHRHMLDLVGDEIDEDAQRQLDELKTAKMEENIAELDDICLRINYKECVNETKECVAKICDEICDKLVRNILERYTEELHVEHDEHFDEIVQHHNFLLDKVKIFVGRVDMIEKISSHFANNTPTCPNAVCVVYGQSGCGKTALLAKVAQTVQSQFPQAATIIRFIGTTAQSGAARNLLSNVCRQITLIYQRDVNAIPSSYSDLIEYFKTCLGFATSAKPLHIFLDSLDQLSNEDFAMNLKWLPKTDLPAYVKIIVSTLPVCILDTLKSHLPSENLIEVTKVTPADGEQILDELLSVQGRKVTDGQKKVILERFERCPLPLYLHLAAAVAARWSSYEEVEHCQIAEDIPGLITALFQRIESKYGSLFVSHALAYLTAAKNGLSSGELEDILSCDDKVLDEIFSHWIPPFRRIPPLLWIRIRNDLGNYLVERGTDGTMAYKWYHRQFWETAQKRCLDQADDPFRAQAHEAIADYFEEKWKDGKWYVPTSKKETNKNPRLENRQIAAQPLVISGSRSDGRQFNQRKLSELLFQLLRVQDWPRLEQTVFNLEFLEAMFECGKGYDLLSEVRHAAKTSSSDKLRAMSKFIGAGLPHFLRDSIGVYQFALQQVPSNPIRQLAEEVDWAALPWRCTRDQHEDPVENPCEITLKGHTSGIRCCRYSPSGDLVVSTGEDASLRVWDAYSGAEVFTVSGLPGPTFPGLADPYHGERPCHFAADGQTVITGSEDGVLQVFDLNGVQKHNKSVHTQGITAIAVTPTMVLTSSKDATLKAWSTENYDVIKSVQLPGQALGMDISRDLKKAAVCMVSAGLVLVDLQSWEVTGPNRGPAQRNICCNFSPSGDKVISGGDDSRITLWDGRSGVALGSWLSHRGWIWGLTYTPDGSRVVSASSDRTIRVWDAVLGQCIVTLGGHLHRVCWVDFQPGMTNFVSASLDFSLKIWNTKAVMEGNVPETGELHYSVLRVSPCGLYAATAQGWQTAATLKVLASGQQFSCDGGHVGFVHQVAFTSNSCKVIAMDTGHRGSYLENEVQNAKVGAYCLEGGHVTPNILPIQAPSCLAANDRLFVIGTVIGDVIMHDSNTETEIARWKFSQDGSSISSMNLSSRDHVVCVHAQTLRLWTFSVADSKETLIKELQMEANITMALFSPSGSYLVVGTMSGEILVFDADNDYQECKRLLDHNGYVRDITFSPDGVLMATTAVDMNVRVWDIQNGFSLVGVFYGPVNQMGFTGPRQILTGNSTGTTSSIIVA